jgi:hypothetical protein
MKHALHVNDTVVLITGYRPKMSIAKIHQRQMATCIWFDPSNRKTIIEYFPLVDLVKVTEVLRPELTSK